VPEAEAFAYAVIRVVPRLERGESANAGVLLFCRTRDYLAARTQVPTDRLRALDPDVDLGAVARHLRTVELIAAGDPAGGPMAEEPPSARFHWLVAPASTIVQPSEVHTGLLSDPAATLDRLFAQLVS
jgi:hypothetical protein